MDYNTLCSNERTLVSNELFSEIKEDVIILVFPIGEKSFCFTKEELEHISRTSELKLWVPRENEHPARREHPVFMIPYANAWVDKTLMMGVNQGHLIFYVYPAYISGIGSRFGVGRHNGKEDITIYSAIPIPEYVEQLNNLSELREEMKKYMRGILPKSRIEEIVGVVGRGEEMDDERGEGGEGEPDDGFISDEDEIFIPDDEGVEGVDVWADENEDEDEWDEEEEERENELQNERHVGYVVGFQEEFGDDVKNQDNDFEFNVDAVGFFVACSRGNLVKVNEYVQNGINVRQYEDRALVIAIFFGKIEIVERLLELGADPSSRNGQCLINSVKHDDIFEILIDDPRVNPRVRNDQALIEACEVGSIDVIDMLLENDCDPRAQDDAVLGTCSKIQDPNIRLGRLNLFLEKGTDPNKGLQMAVVLNRMDVLKRLMEVGADVKNKGLVTESIQGGSVEMLSFLVEEKAGTFNEAFTEACRLIKIDVVLWLLTPVIVQEQQINRILITPAIEKEIRYLILHSQSLNLLKFVLDDERFDPKLYGCEFLYITLSRGGYGYDVLTEYTLLDPRINPGDQDNKLIIRLAKDGHLKGVIRLLQDPRVNPADQNNKAIKEAHQNRHLSVVNELRKHVRLSEEEKEELREERDPLDYS